MEAIIAKILESLYPKRYFVFLRITIPYLNRFNIIHQFT